MYLEWRRRKLAKQRQVFLQRINRGTSCTAGSASQKRYYLYSTNRSATVVFRGGTTGLTRNKKDMRVQDVTTLGSMTPEEKERQGNCLTRRTTAHQTSVTSHPWLHPGIGHPSRRPSAGARKKSRGGVLVGGEKKVLVPAPSCTVCCHALLLLISLKEYEVNRENGKLLRYILEIKKDING